MSTKCCLAWINHEVEVRSDQVFLFNREVELVWVQGVVVVIDNEQHEAIIDDGTDVVQLSFQNARVKYNFKEGQYVLIQAHVIVGEDESGQTVFFLDAKRIEPLHDPNFETLWLLEVVAAHQTTKRTAR